MPKRHSQEEIERGLLMLVLHSGNSKEAAKALADNDMPISERVLRDWRDRHSQRYAEIQTDAAPAVAKRIASQAEQIMLKAGDIEHSILDKLSSKIAEGKLSGAELATALQKVSSSKSLNNEKISAPIRGRPSSITEHRLPDEIIRSLAARGLIVDTDADADAIAVEEDPLELGAGD
jgi:hypothetical protein